MAAQKLFFVIRRGKPCDREGSSRWPCPPKHRRPLRGVVKERLKKAPA
eukprot:CAMPEP_0172587888 /NCGR_PEP_ID=MMETSP1068-20121228/6877_1 /TAXON_ID=35684 /ORGANISM="Pseudopedinella elastica, Strain CCMP716" /LENGTH=47 /DNA_ID= /DNA_START= /DNA_END= /DNA_ORIENTATION=